MAYVFVTFRRDPFFQRAMGIKQRISSSRLRQRFDEDAEANRRRCRREPSIDFMNACAFFKKAVYTS
jgi:hypothetical protein